MEQKSSSSNNIVKFIPPINLMDADTINRHFNKFIVPRTEKIRQKIFKNASDQKTIVQFKNVFMLFVEEMYQDLKQNNSSVNSTSENKFSITTIQFNQKFVQSLLKMYSKVLSLDKEGDYRNIKTFSELESLISD